MRIVLLSLICLFSFVAQAAVVERVVEYKKAAESFEGFIAFDDSSTDSKPGVLVVHDWMGVTEKTREKARELAQLGYIAFAADIYGKGVRPKDAAEAGALAGKYKTDRKLFRERLTLGLQELRKQKRVDSQRLGAIGFCFGGTGVLELARTGATLKSVVSFHGGLDSPEPQLGKNIRARVLALHGADDPYVPEKDLAAFESEMRTHKVDWQLVKYGGAVHSFTDKTAGTDNSKGAAYNEVAARRSWVDMKQFFSESL